MFVIETACASFVVFAADAEAINEPETTPISVNRALTLAYDFGKRMVDDGECDAYNVGMNCGISAGQTVMYPHIHLIPRRRGDMADPAGGVRHVIPEKGKY